MTGLEKKGYLYVLLTGIFFSIEVIGYKSVFQEYRIPPILAAFTGISFSFLLVSPWCLATKVRRERIRTTLKRDTFAFFLGTTLNAIGVALYYFALSKSELGPASVLVKTTALFNVLFGVVFLGERFSIRDRFGLLLAILGIYLMSTIRGFGLESLWILLSAFFFSFQSFLIKKYAPKIHPIEFAYLRLFVLAFWFGIFIFYQGIWEIIPLEIILRLGLYSFLGFFLGRAFFFAAHHFLPIGKLNSVMLLEPIFLLAFGILIWGEEVSLAKLAGAFLVLLGILLLVLPTRQIAVASGGISLESRQKIP